MDLRRFASFVEAHGTTLEKARFACLFYGREPAAAAVQPFLALQNSDGGFAWGMQPRHPSAISETVTALTWLDDLGMLPSPAADRACGYLLAVQREDGGWDEDPALAEYGVPPWAVPGDLKARLYLSAQGAYWLAVRGHRGDALERALRFLLDHRDAGGKFYGFLHSTWIATSAFVAAGPGHEEVVQAGLRVLSSRPFSEWVDSQIAWALESLGRAGLPREEPFVQQGLAELRRRQEAQGSWVAEDGEAWTVNAVIGALNALRCYGALEDPVG